MFALVTLQAFPGHPVPGWCCFDTCLCTDLELQSDQKDLPASALSHLTLGLLRETPTAGEGRSEADGLSVGEDKSSPPPHAHTNPGNGYFPNNSVMFPFRTLSRPKNSSLKDSYKAFIMKGCPQPELREGGAVTIAPEGRAANKSRPLPGRGDERAERCRFGTRGGVEGRCLQPPTTKAFKKYYHKHLCRSENANCILPP